MTWVWIVFAYMIGGLPFAVWIGRFRGGADPREHGSRNPGATNVLRLHGWRRALLVLGLDLGKGWLVVRCAAEFLTHDPAALPAVGLAVIAGHVWSPWSRFRGGKGVATAAGVFLAFEPTALALAAGLFLVVVAVGRRVAVGSLLAALAMPFLLYFREFASRPGLDRTVVLAALVAALLFYTHRSNLRRLLAGEEPPIDAGHEE